jgi:hypothetical protein
MGDTEVGAALSLRESGPDFMRDDEKIECLLITTEQRA